MRHGPLIDGNSQDSIQCVHAIDRRTIRSRCKCARKWSTMTRVNRVGAAAAVLGPALLFVYYWSEEAFGPSQPNGGPLRGALGIQLITGALICFAIALLRLRAERLNGDSRTARLSTWLGRLAVWLLLIGSALGGRFFSTGRTSARSRVHPSRLGRWVSWRRGCLSDWTPDGTTNCPRGRAQFLSDSLRSSSCFST